MRIPPPLLIWSMALEVEKPIIVRRGDREAARAYSRWHYSQNKSAYKARAKAHDAKERARRKAFVVAYLAEHPCIDCDEADPIVLEFDHREGETKLFNIADHQRWYQCSMATLIAEIAKCEVRCANCHRRKTYRERGFRCKG